jgi:hypothetical protein
MAGSLTAALLMCLAPIATDGDTVRCGAGQGWTRVRIWGVQAPETGQPGAEAAKVALQARVAGGIVCEPRGASYSRVVGLCYDGTGRDVGMELLQVDHVVTEWCSYTKSKLFPNGYYGTCTMTGVQPAPPARLTSKEGAIYRCAPKPTGARDCLMVWPLQELTDAEADEASEAFCGPDGNTDWD